MKLRLPKALTAALMAGMVGNLSVSELRAESIDYSKYASTADTSALTTNLVYANSFTTADTVDYSKKMADGTTDVISFTGTAPTVNNGQATINSSYKATGLGAEGKLGSNGFTISFDLSSFSANNWRDLLTISTNNASTDNCSYSLQVQKNGNNQLAVYYKDDPDNNPHFANAATVTKPDNSDIFVGIANLDKSTLTLVYNPAATTADGTAAQVSYYLDGTLVRTLTLNYDATHTASPTVTGIYFGTSSNGSGRAFTNATIDNLSIWDGALSAEQVQDLAILKWTGNEGASATWASLNNNAATRTQVQATVTPTATEGDAATWTFGAAGSTVAAGITDFTVSGGALKMDVAAGSSLALGTAHLTDGSTLAVNGATNIATLSADSGSSSFKLEGTSATVGALKVAANASLAIDSEKELSFNNDTLSLAAGATITLADGTTLAQTAQNYKVTTREGVAGSISTTSQSEGSLWGSQLTIENMAVTFTGNRHVNAKLTGSDVITDTNSATGADGGTRFIAAQNLNSLTVNGNTWVERDMTIAEGLTVANGKTLVVNNYGADTTPTLSRSTVTRM